MVFDKTQPQDTTKLRNLGTVIRPNWEAIEEAAVTFKPQALNLADRTAGAIVPTDPVAPADTVTIYCKQDGAGDPQAFITDPAAAILQLTNLTVGSVANAGTGGGTTYYIDTPWGIRFLWGLINAGTGDRTVILPAGSGTVASYQCTANSAAAAVGATIGGLTLTINTAANVSVRWFVICT